MSPADVVFSLPPEARADDTAHALRFIRDLVQQFDIADDKVRMGLVPRDCLAVSARVLVHVSRGWSRDGFLGKSSKTLVGPWGVLMSSMLDTKEVSKVWRLRAQPPSFSSKTANTRFPWPSP